MGTPKKQPQQKLNKYFRLLPVLCIVSVWIIFSSPYFFKGLVPFPSTYLVTFFNPWNNYYGMPVKNGAMPDVITQIYPWKKITIESIKMGVMPVWNPYQFSGNPHLANVQSAVFTPFNLLFFILPFIDAWSILILLQPLCAGLFMYLFLRSIRLSQYASILGGISFMFCSFIVTWMAYGTLGFALLFLPLLLYGIERYSEKKDWIAILLLISSPPLSVFSGHFQTSLYVLIVGFCYVLFRSIAARDKKILVMAALYIGIGGFISLLQIIPTYRFYSQSVRSGSYIQEEAIPWNQLVRVFAPDFFGNPVTRNDWIGHYAEWGTYAGVVPFILALFALSSSRNKFGVYFFGSILAVAVLFAFQPQFISLLALSKIPVLSTSTPSRIVGIVSFCIAVLAAFGLDSVLQIWKDKKIPKSLIAVALISLVVVALVWIVALTMEADPAKIATRNLVLPTGMAIIAVCIFFAGFMKVKFFHILLPVLLVVLTAFEMVRFSTKWMPFDPREYVYPESPLITYLQENAQENRVYGLLGNELFGVFHLYGIEGYDPLYSKRYGEFIASTDNGTIQVLPRSAVVFPRKGRYNKLAIDILGVKYLVHSKGDGHAPWVFPFWEYPDSFTRVFSDEKYEVYENHDAYPRAFLVHSYKIVTDGQKIIDEILAGHTDMRKTVVLEQEPDLSGGIHVCDAKDPVESAQIEQYLPTEIIIKTQSPCNSLLVLSDVYYPGWVAYIDGEEKPLYRANYTFRAVPVLQGEHTVTLRYENWYL